MCSIQKELEAIRLELPLIYLTHPSLPPTPPSPLEGGVFAISVVCTIVANVRIQDF